MLAQGVPILPNRSSSFDVAVVGGGVIGLSVAWRVAQRGLSVVVLERGAESVRRLRAGEARRLEPALAPTLRLALEILDDHAIDPRKLAPALVRALSAAGGELRTDAPVAVITTHGERVTGARLADTGEEI